MKKIIIVMALLIHSVFNCNVFCQCKKEQTQNKVQIDFRDFFEEDTISVRINNYLIVENKIITSDEVIGFAWFRIKLISPNKVSFDSTDMVLPCSFKLKTNVTISIILNGKEESFDVDLEKGRFLGFSKNKNQLYFLQRQSPFFYD